MATALRGLTRPTRRCDKCAAKSIEKQWRGADSNEGAAPKICKPCTNDLCDGKGVCGHSIDLAMCDDRLPRTFGVGSAVDTGTCFADHHDGDVGQVAITQGRLDEGLGFSAARAVADGDGGRLELAHEVAQFGRCLGRRRAAGVGIDRCIAAESASGVDRRAFAAGAQAGVDA